MSAEHRLALAAHGGSDDVCAGVRQVSRNRPVHDGPDERRLRQKPLVAPHSPNGANCPSSAIMFQADLLRATRASCGVRLGSHATIAGRKPHCRPRPPGRPAPISVGGTRRRCHLAARQTRRGYATCTVKCAPPTKGTTNGCTPGEVAVDLELAYRIVARTTTMPTGPTRRYRPPTIASYPRMPPSRSCRRQARRSAIPLS